MIPMESKINALTDDAKKSKTKNQNLETFLLNNLQMQHEFDRK
jgi:hypothetical protein